MKKRVLAALLSVMLLVGLLPSMAFGAYSGNANPIIDSATVVWKDNKNQIKLVMSTNYGNGQELHVGVINKYFIDLGVCDAASISNISDKITNEAMGVYVNIPANSANVQGGTVYADLTSLPKADNGTDEMVNGTVQILVWSSGTGTGNWNLSSAGDAVTITDGKGEVTKEDPTKDLYTIGSAKTYTGSALNPEITPKANAGAVTNIYLADDNTGTNKTAANAGQTPAGTYHVFVDVAASTLYNAKTDLYLGTWKINKANQAKPTLSKTDMDADGKGGKITITDYDGKLKYEYKKSTEEWAVATTATGAEIAIDAEATYDVRVKGDDNHNPSAHASVAIIQAGKPVATLSDKEVTYDGKAQSVDVKVTQDGKDKTTEYTVYYTGTDGTTYGKTATAPTNAGKYTVTVEKTGGGTPLAQTATLTIKKATPDATPTADKIDAEGKTLADANLDGSASLNGKDVAGNFAWDDADTTKVEQGKAYGWTFTPTDADNYNEVKGTIILWPAAGGSGIVISGSTKTYTVTYSAGSHGNFSGDAATTEKVEKNASPKNVPVVHPHDNYRFMGWSLDGKTVVDPTAQKITKDVTFTALYEVCDHMAYMVGRSDTQFAPNGNLTRAEAATILSRLTEGFSETGTYPAAPYTDLNASAWYVKYVNFAASKGIVNGRPDGTFDPDASITRAEFATMIANFAGIAQSSAASVSSDVNGHWAAGYISALEQASIVTGYEDGTFRPNRTITRAEAATMVNGAIDRTPDTNLDLAENSYTNPFTDVNAGQWFFAQVMEATVNHVTAHFHSGK